MSASVRVRLGQELFVQLAALEQRVAYTGKKFPRAALLRAALAFGLDTIGARGLEGLLAQVACDRVRRGRARRARVELVLPESGA